jgi:hypothetical protein
MNTWTFLIIAAPLLAAYGWVMHSIGLNRGFNIGTELSLDFIETCFKEFEKEELNPSEEKNENANL